MEAPPGWTLRCTLRAHQGQIGRLAWSQDASLLATPGLDGYVIVWKTDDGRPLRVIRHGGPVASVAFSPDAERLAYGHADATGPAFSNDYLRDEEFELDEPLPPEVDEMLGDYSASTEWESDPMLSPGATISVCIADTHTGERLASFYSERITAPISDLVWTTQGRDIFTVSHSGLARWQTRTGQLLSLDPELSGHSITPSSDDRELVIASWSDWLRVRAPSWREIAGGGLDQYLPWADEESLTSIASSPSAVAMGVSDGTIVVLRSDGTERQLEGHTRAVTSVSFSSDGLLLASKALDGTVRLWDCLTWDALSVLHEPARGQAENAGIAFAPTGHSLATLGPAGKVVRIWDLDLPTIMARRDVAPTVHYANAKVVLLGDSGVGKTGLGLVLAGEKFRPTESSHRRNVWLLNSQDYDAAQPERRETYLWDLAGQPGYRLLHQLHLGDAAVAIILFDAKSESDPFAGVRHWVRALRQAERHGTLRAPRLLVAARMDRGGPRVSDERISEALTEFGFEAYIETSAKNDRGIEDLQEAISSRIDWPELPKVSSTGLFESIKSFLVAERDRDRLLVSGKDLRNAYVATQAQESNPDDLAEEFDTCTGRVAARGLIRRLSFGGLVLLRPEVLDAYAASLTMAARDQPDGMGSISEEVARRGDFVIPAEDRLADPDLERLLLAATVEEVLRHEVALREHSEDGPYLVFPTQSRREAPSLEDPHRIWLSIQFEGPVQNVYATLVVRLAHSGLFARDSTFRNATTFKAKSSRLGVSVEEIFEGVGKLSLFSTGQVDEKVSSWFTDYVIAHVRRRAVADTVSVDDAIRCGGCNLELTTEILHAARERGKTKITCPVCDTQIDVVTRTGITPNELVVKQMDDQADEERARATAAAALHGKEEVGEFDVFLAHHSADKDAVKRIAENLRSYGVNPWIDDEQVPPGRWFQDHIERAIGLVGSAAIILGKGGLGKWEAVELKSFTAECVNHGLPVIPVLLPGASMPRELRFLQQLSWVRFRKGLDEADAIDRLRWGITGQRESAAPE